MHPPRLMRTSASAADRVFLDCRGALASPSVVPAARDRPPAVELIVVTAQEVNGSPAGTPDAAGLKDRLRDGRAVGRVPADPGRSGVDRRTSARDHRAVRGFGRGAGRS